MVAISKEDRDKLVAKARLLERGEVVAANLGHVQLFRELLEELAVECERLAEDIRCVSSREHLLPHDQMECVMRSLQFFPSRVALDNLVSRAFLAEEQIFSIKHSYGQEVCDD